MSVADTLAGAVLVAVVLGAAGMGLAAHLLWLLLTNPRQLAALGREVLGL